MMELQNNDEIEIDVSMQMRLKITQKIKHTK